MIQTTMRYTAKDSDDFNDMQIEPISYLQRLNYDDESQIAVRRRAGRREDARLRLARRSPAPTRAPAADRDRTFWPTSGTWSA